MKLAAVALILEVAAAALLTKWFGWPVAWRLLIVLSLLAWGNNVSQRIGRP